eukprot:TRINITY_DN47170_c0_g1_i1.p1 TRINITY_DN47170_c0_g1~~TRINITY_DN47170_c0_g1_i1.p1  ORF type:complete len:483 (-),score=73.80 TRINITY_DN47170_c0_g1_i1:155-1603(-)
MDSAPSKAAFFFPAASGHINPSLPIARALASQGWLVEYLSIPQFKEAIEDTGAAYVDRDALCKDHGIDDVTAMVKATFSEYEDPGAMMWALNFGSISTQRLLPIYAAWLRSGGHCLVVYCPVLCQVAHFAALQLDIPDVSVLTAPGPGYWDAAFAGAGSSASGLLAAISKNAANNKAVEALRAELKRPDLRLNTEGPVVFDYYTGVNLVTTTAELAEPLNVQDAECYRQAGKEFLFIGPLLDVEGAKRTAGAALPEKNGDATGIIRKVDAALSANRKVVYVSLGTVVTGDSEEFGWSAKAGSAMTGGQLCQAVFRAVFKQLGSAEEGPDQPLIIVATGSRSEALEGIDVPPNAVTAKVVPQVDLLRKGKPVLFVTHGGQNSIMESMSVGTPVVVCPGFGDQPANAAKVHKQGWGLKVDRPKPSSDKSDEDLQADYQASVQEAIKQVLADARFASKANLLGKSLSEAEGVPGAVRVLLQAAKK